MSRVLASASPATLRTLAAAFEAGQLGLPVAASMLRSRVAPGEAERLATELTACAKVGITEAGLSLMLRALADEREAQAEAPTRAELVWTGPETRGAASRDTWAVAQQLFGAARRRVLLSCYAFHDGREILRPLAARMDAEPGLCVRIFVDVGRKPRDGRDEAELLREFTDRFLKREWSGARRPEVFHDPRSLAPGRGPRSVLHAKCIVIDDEVAFITSANLSEAAHERNIEAGLLVRDAAIAGALVQQFDSLVAAGVLKRVPGLG